MKALNLDPSKKVTHFVAADVGLALHDPDTDWAKIGVLIRTLDNLVRINAEHGHIAGANRLGELAEVLRGIEGAKSRERLVNMFEKFKLELEEFNDAEVKERF